MSLNGQVNNLNRDVFQALKQVKDPKQVTEAEAKKIADAVLKDGTMDAPEADLLRELTSANNVNVRVSSNFEPNTLSFSPLQGNAREILKGMEQLGGGFEDLDAGGASFGVADATGLVADITGIFDPTPISDGVSGVISLGQGDFKGAGLSVVSMVPYFGDAVGKPAKIMKRVLDAFPHLSRLVKSVDDVPVLLKTLEKLGPGLKSPAKVSETLNALSNLQKGAEAAYKNPKWLEGATKRELPTEGPIPFVPPKRWDPNRPLKTSDGRGFIDAYGNEWRKGETRTAGEHIEWDVIPKNKNGGIANLSRDGSHVNVSLQGVVTHR